MKIGRERQVRALVSSNHLKRFIYGILAVSHEIFMKPETPMLSKMYKNQNHAQFVKSAHISPKLRPYLLPGTETSHIRTAGM